MKLETQCMGIYKYIMGSLLDRVFKYHQKYLRQPSNMDELRRITAVHDHYKFRMCEAKLASILLNRLAQDPEVALLPSRLTYEESKMKIINTSHKIDKNDRCM